MTHIQKQQCVLCLIAFLLISFCSADLKGQKLKSNLAQALVKGEQNSIVGSPIFEPKFLSQSQSQQYYTSGRANFNNGGAVAGFIFGIIFLLCGFPLLWNNERKQVRMAALINKAKIESIEIDASKPSIDNDYNLVYASGRFEAFEVLKDIELGIQEKNEVKLIRKVEIYCWVRHQLSKEERRRTGDTYEYRKEWSTSIDHFSQQDGRPNPQRLILQEKTFSAKYVYLNRYLLSQSQIDRLDKVDRKPFTDIEIENMNNQFSGRLQNEGYHNFINCQGFAYARKKNSELSQSTPYEGSTQIGDIRVSYKVVKCGDISLIAQQIPLPEAVKRDLQDQESQQSIHMSKDGLKYPAAGLPTNTFRQWNPKKVKDEDNEPDEERVCLLCACCPCAICIDKCFTTWIAKEVVDYSQAELKKKDDIIEEKLSDNSTTTLIFRVLGFLLIYFGIYLLFSPIIGLVSWIPLIGVLIAHGISFLVWIVALPLSIFFAGITISIAWLYYRPLWGLLSVTIIGAVTGIILFACKA